MGMVGIIVCHGEIYMFEEEICSFYVNWGKHAVVLGVLCFN